MSTGHDETTGDKRVMKTCSKTECRRRCAHVVPALALDNVEEAAAEEEEEDTALFGRQDSVPFLIVI